MFTRVPLTSREVAVLPFVNLSGHPRQEYFSSGVTEDSIAALGRFSGVLVMSHNAVRAYAGTPSRVSGIGREPGVRYIAQGSVRQADGRVRVAAELVDAGTGRQLWTDRVDGHGKDLFDIQDRIVRSIVGALAQRRGRLHRPGRQIPFRERWDERHEAGSGTRSSALGLGGRVLEYAVDTGGAPT